MKPWSRVRRRFLLAASVFHFRTFTVRQVKEYPAERGPVRRTRPLPGDRMAHALGVRIGAPSLCMDYMRAIYFERLLQQQRRRAWESSIFSNGHPRKPGASRPAGLRDDYRGNGVGNRRLCC